MKIDSLSVSGVAIILAGLLAKCIPLMGMALPPAPPKQKIRILFVDDEDAAHIILRIALDLSPEFDFQIINAKSLPEADAILETETVDIVLLDLRLEYSVDSARNTVRAIPKYAARYPVAVITGMGTPDLWATCLQAGALDFFQKEIFLKPSNSWALVKSLVNIMLLHRAKYASR